MGEFESELTKLINKHGEDSKTNTPDYILSRYLVECLTTFRYATASRDQWYKPSDTRPHSRACGMHKHEHGPDCHTNCPTCGGK